jgi:RHS repeat-associated protein
VSIRQKTPPEHDQRVEINTYDTRNRLTGALGTSYVYDADGQRVGKSKTGETTTFAVDVGSELSKVLVRTKNGVPTRYVWGLGLLYEVNGSGGSATTVSYHHDATGSTIALTDDSATVIERIGYTPWGQINHRANLAGTLHDTPFLFTGFFGNQTDDNGLLYMRNRYYHPLIGRFLNADPAQEGMNWYGYGGGNPIGMVDPMGLGITSALNAVQSTLSFLGMIPVFGAVFDVVNAGISIGRGNYLDAGFNLASAIPGIGDFAAGAKLIGAGAAAYGGYKGYSVLSRAGYSFSGNMYSGIPFPTRHISAPTQPYQVGSFSSLQRSSRSGDGLDLHHVSQSHPLSQLTSYNRSSAPAIALPRAEHAAIPNIRGTYGGSARSLLANDIWNLRSFTNSPNSQLIKLIEMNKSMYPGILSK